MCASATEHHRRHVVGLQLQRLRQVASSHARNRLHRAAAAPRDAAARSAARRRLAARQMLQREQPGQRPLVAELAVELLEQLDERWPGRRALERAARALAARAPAGRACAAASPAARRVARASPARLHASSASARPAQSAQRSATRAAARAAGAAPRRRCGTRAIQRSSSSIARCSSPGSSSRLARRNVSSRSRSALRARGPPRARARCPQQRLQQRSPASCVAPSSARPRLRRACRPGGHLRTQAAAARCARLASRALVVERCVDLGQRRRRVARRSARVDRTLEQLEVVRRELARLRSSAAASAAWPSCERESRSLDQQRDRRARRLLCVVRPRSRAARARRAMSPRSRYQRSSRCAVALVARARPVRELERLLERAASAARCAVVDQPARVARARPRVAAIRRDR